MDSARRRQVAGIVWAVGALLIARVGMGKAHIVYYVSDRGFHAITRDGTARRSFARVLHPDVHPPIVFSPDGRRIVFAYEPREPIEAMGDICIVNTDGSGWRNLTNRLDWDTDPDWSPDGSKIVYASRDGPRRELYTIAPDGSDKRLLRQDGLSNGTDQWPTYSPDGTKVAFTASSNAGGRGMNISVVDAEGDDYREIQSDLNSWSPSWSPGGTRIAFVADRDNDNADIYVMRADGKRVRRLTEHPGWDTWASWAPDGSEVAFLSGRDGGQRPRLYIVDADTGRVRRVSDRDDVSDKPTWVRATALGLSAARRKIVAWGWLRRPRGR